VVAVGVIITGKTEPQENDVMAETSGMKEQGHTDRLFGMNSLKEGAM
jgi:hypothetical protein